MDLHVIQSLQAAKRAHTLDKCTDADSFLRAFREQAGETVEDVIARYACRDLVAGAVLGGSIPLGVATSASDVDLIVIVDDVAALRSRTPGRATNEDVSAEFVEDAEALMAAEVVAVAGGIELNLQFVVMSRVLDLTSRLKRSGVWISLTGQATILGRLKTGWLLLSSPRFGPVHSALMKDHSLEIHCAVRYFVFALQCYEDARAAVMAYDHDLAQHLGRMSVEMCFLSYLASHGCVAPGGKWFRLLKASPGGNRGRPADGRLWSAGRPLLFPLLTGATDQVRWYLRDVAAFLSTSRELIEQRTAFKVAFRLCPQIFDPEE